MSQNINKKFAGFSLVELIVSMTVVLVLMGVASTLLSRAMSVRARESRTTDALTSAQAALNIMSREITNSGFGIYDNAISETADNGIIVADSGDHRIHFRANINNFGPGPIAPTCTAVCTSDPGEDVTYYFDSATSSIVRYDPRGTPQTSVVVNKISNVTFSYFDYTAAGAVTAEPGNASPSANTGRIRLTVEVALDRVEGQVNPASVRFLSEINLRNSNYMLHQY
jgi:prepilin-type N-terminal cleavage/methylation domain-containing protein